MRREDGGEAGPRFKQEPENHLLLVDVTLACNQRCLFFAVTSWVRNKEPVQIETSILELNQDEIKALAHFEPQVAQWVTICSTTSTNAARTLKQDSQTQAILVNSSGQDSCANRRIFMENPKLVPFSTHSSSGLLCIEITNSITGSRCSVGTRKPRSYAVGTSNETLRTKY